MSNPDIASKPVNNIVNRLPAAVFEYTYFSDGRKGFTYISPYCEVLFGLTSEMMMSGSLSLRSFIHSDDRESFFEDFQNSLETASTFSWEGRIVTPQKELWINALATPVKMMDRVVWTGLLSDISAQYETKEAIRKSETLFSQLFHNSPFGKVMLDESGKVALVNSGFERMFGFSQDELQGNELNQFIVPSDLKTEGNDLDTLISAKQIVRIDTIRKRKNGEHFPVIVYGVPVQLGDKTIGIFGSYVDMTDQKRTEEELKVRNAELDNFVYKVSHDLRAPLSSVLGLVNLARLEGNTDNLFDYIKIIGQKVKQLDNFISDVLSHSKNLKLDVKIAPIDFHELVNQTFTSLDYLKGVDQIKKFVQIEGCSFHSDPWRLGEIFRNLVSNAIKYRDFNKEESTISINIFTSMQQTAILFSDNGIGIDEKNQRQIFDMFYRASDQSEGSGLGLYIVKNAVEKLGGSIHLSSSLGSGTSFELKLPNNLPVNPTAVA